MRIYDHKVSMISDVAFSWKLEGDAGQLFYRIEVVDEEGVSVWDTDKVYSAERHNISCEVKLLPHHTFGWKLTVGDTAGNVEEAEGKPFSTGLEEWKACWVEPDRVRRPMTDTAVPITDVIEQKDPADVLDPAICMRKSFRIEELPDKAYLYASARGIYNLYVNGKRVSDLFAPGVTSYGKRIEYQCMDVTKELVPGENVISAVLADGWYTGKVGAVGMGQQYGKENALLFQLDMRCQEKWSSVCSDAQMKMADSAWEYADLFVGSGYDASKEQEGWKLAGFDDSAWKNVKVCDYGYQELSLQTIPPIQIVRTITPKIILAPNGDFLLDAGETMVGFVSVSLMMNAGDVLKLEHTEVLDKEGNFMVNIIGQNKNQTDVYRCAQDGLVEWTPEFTYHGFRYVRVTGTNDQNPEHFKLHVLWTPMSRTGNFTCDDPRINQLQENILRSQQGNMIAIPTDCPQREKTGWTGDAQVYAPTACYELDVEQFLRHWLIDMENDQLPDGQIPHIIPYIPSHDIMKPAWIDGVSAGGWSDACVIVPWRLYEAYGDLRILEDSYPMMERYMDSLKLRVAANPANVGNPGEHMKYIWNNDFQYGDWLMPSAVKSGLVGPPMMMLTGFEAGTLMYAYTNMLMNKICLALGKNEEAEAYGEIHAKVADAFMKEFANEDGTLKKDFQGLYVLALEMDVVPKEKRKNTIDKLVSLIHENGDRLDTGFLSIPFLLPVLAENGHKDLANTLLFQDKEPSWLYEIKCGATTLWESWEAIDEEGNPKNYSMNHFAFGCVGEYLFRYIAGIHAESIGFRKVRIEPDFTCGLKEVNASYDCIYGKVAVHWKLEAERKTLEVILPPDVEGIAVVDGEEMEIKGRFACDRSV